MTIYKSNQELFIFVLTEQTKLIFWPTISRTQFQVVMNKIYMQVTMNSHIVLSVTPILLCQSLFCYNAINSSTILTVTVFLSCQSLLYYRAIHCYTFTNDERVINVILFFINDFKISSKWSTLCQTCISATIIFYSFCSTTTSLSYVIIVTRWFCAT